jgi:hypothetical protein
MSYDSDFDRCFREFISSTHNLEGYILEGVEGEYPEDREPTESTFYGGDHRIADSGFEHHFLSKSEGECTWKPNRYFQASVHGSEVYLMQPALHPTQHMLAVKKRGRKVKFAPEGETDGPVTSFQRTRTSG